MTGRIPLLAMAALLVGGATGCGLFHRQRKPVTPSPPVVEAPPVEAPKPAEPPQPETKPPEPLPPPAAPAPPPPAVAPEAKPAKQPPRKPRRKPQRTAHPAQTPPAPPTPAAPAEPPAAPAPPAAPLPQLSEVLTSQQRDEYLRRLNRDVAEAQRILNSLKGRSLGQEGSETAARVRAFIEQAREKKGSDLGAAVEFARRARLLAEDLLSSIR